jgi:hypothetical protein
LAGNAEPETNDTFPETITDDKIVILKASASMCANSDYVWNEINESEQQYEKHAEQKI